MSKNSLFSEALCRIAWPHFALACLWSFGLLITPASICAQTQPIDTPCEQQPTEVYPGETEFRSGRKFSGIVRIGGDVILKDGTYIVEEGAILQMTPTFCPANSATPCEIYNVPGFSVAPGHPYTRIIVGSDAHLIIEGGVITTADCQTLWGGIIVEEGGSLTTRAGATTGVPAQITQGMWGIAFTGVTGDAGRLSCEQTQFINNYKFSLALALGPEAPPVHLAKLTLLGDPDLMGYPYTSAQWGGPIVPARGIVFLETPWDQPTPIVLSEIRITHMLRGVCMSQDASVGLVQLDNCEFEDCYERAVSLPNVNLNQCHFHLPDAYPVGPLGQPGGYGPFDPASVGCSPDYYRGNPAEDFCLLSSVNPTDIERVRTTEIYGATGFQMVARGCSFLGTGQMAQGPQVGLATSKYCRGVRLEGNTFNGLATGVNLKGPTALGSTQKLDNNLFQNFGTAVKAEGALVLNEFTCNRFNAAQWPNALALYHLNPMGELINGTTQSLNGGTTQKPCANIFLDFAPSISGAHISALGGIFSYSNMLGFLPDIPHVQGTAQQSISLMDVPWPESQGDYCTRSRSTSQNQDLNLTLFDPAQSKLLSQIEKRNQSKLTPLSTPPPTDSVCFAPPQGLQLMAHGVHARHKGVLIQRGRSSVNWSFYECAARPDRCPPLWLSIPTTVRSSPLAFERWDLLDLGIDSTQFKVREYYAGDSILLGSSWFRYNRKQIVTLSPNQDTLSVLSDPYNWFTHMSGTYMINMPNGRDPLGNITPDTFRVYDLSRPGPPSVKLTQLGRANLFPRKLTYEADGSFRFITEAQYPINGRMTSMILIGLMDTTFRIVELDTIMPRDHLIQQGGGLGLGAGWYTPATNGNWGLLYDDYSVLSDKRYRVGVYEYINRDVNRSEIITGHIGGGTASQRRHAVIVNNQPVRANAHLIGPALPLRDGGTAVLNASDLHEQINGQVQVSILDSNDNLVRVIRVAPVFDHMNHLGFGRRLKWSTIVPLSDSSILVKGEYQHNDSTGQRTRTWYRVLSGVPVAPVQAIPPSGLIPDSPLSTRPRTAGLAPGANRITLYPNPARHQVTLSGTFPADAWLELHATTGQRLMRIPAREAASTVTLPATLRPGLYHWQVVSGLSGQRLAIGRLVCQ